MANQTVTSPIGEFEWAYIDGEGKEDLNGTPKFSIDLVLEGAAAEQFKAEIDKFWADNKPKGATKPKSTGYYDHSVKDEEASQAKGENVYTKTGKTVFRFKTGITYQSGDPKVIRVFNSKGAEVSLMGKKIGNGSRGRVQGVLGIYNINKATQGTTLYLNGIQITKFVEYAGIGFEEAEDSQAGEDGGFEGVGDGLPPAPTETAAENEANRPRL